MDSARLHFGLAAADPSAHTRQFETFTLQDNPYTLPSYHDLQAAYTFSLRIALNEQHHSHFPPELHWRKDTLSVSAPLRSDI